MLMSKKAHIRKKSDRNTDVTDFNRTLRPRASASPPLNTFLIAG